MKTGLITLLLFLTLTAFGQNHLITLERETIFLPNRKFNIVDVYDLRQDTTRVGIVQTGMLNKKTLANLAGGCSRHLTAYLGVVLPPQPGLDSVVLLISVLQVSELTVGMSESGTLVYRYRFLLVRGGELFDILEVHDAITENGMDVTKKHESRIRWSLLKSLTRLMGVDLATAVTKPAVLDSKSVEKKYPIQSAPKPIKGIYCSLQEFRDNQPSMVREFEIRRKSKGARVWLGTIENRPFYIDEKGERVKIKEEIWGFSDGEKCYIQVKREYFELINRNGTFEYWGYTTMAEETSYKVGGLIGSIPQRILFQLDLETGQSIRL